MNGLKKIINEDMKFQMQTYSDLFDEKEIMRILDEENRIEDEKDKAIQSLKMENQQLKQQLKSFDMTDPAIHERNMRFFNDLFEDR